MKLFEGIHDLLLYNYDMYCKTLDYNWFRTDYTGKESKLEEALLYPHAMKIIDEYYLRLNNKSYQLDLQKMAKINALQTKFFSINTLLDVLEIGFDNGEMEQRYAVIIELNKYGFQFPLLGNHQDDLENVSICRIQVKAIKNEISKLKERVALLEIAQQKRDGAMSFGALFLKSPVLAWAVAAMIVIYAKLKGTGYVQ